MPIYMKIEGLEGESTSRGHEKWFDVFSFSWGETNVATHLGSGAGAGKVSMSDLSVMKSSGKSSPKLFLYCAQGKHLPAVQLEVTRSGPDQEELFQRWTLEDCLITSYQTSGDGDSRPTESLSINFTKITYLQTYQNADGMTQSQQAYWDLKTNKGG